jgi:hypothetical protein
MIQMKIKKTNVASFVITLPSRMDLLSQVSELPSGMVLLSQSLSTSGSQRDRRVCRIVYRMSDVSVSVNPILKMGLTLTLPSDTR